MATFRVRMFAHLKDRHGEWVSVESEPSREALLSALAAAGVANRGCRLSANLQFASEGQTLNESDELALIPPVSGG